MIYAIKDHVEGQIHDSDFLGDVAYALQFHGSVFVCFAGQENSGTAEDSEAARVVTSGGCLTRCDGQGCSAESQQVDGWLFVGPTGQQRHYCQACLVSYLEGMREQSPPEQRAAPHGTRTASPSAAPAPPAGGMLTRTDYQDTKGYTHEHIFFRVR